MRKTNILKLRNYTYKKYMNLNIVGASLSWKVRLRMKFVYEYYSQLYYLDKSEVNLSCVVHKHRRQMET